MNATQKLIALAKTFSALTTDYALAQRLDWTTARVSNYRRGVSQADEAGAIELAKLANVRIEYALNLIAADRAKNPTAKAAYLRAAERLAA